MRNFFFILKSLCGGKFANTPPSEFRPASQVLNLAFLKPLALVLLFVLGSVNVWGETIYSETFGTSGNNTAWSSYSGWSDSFTSKHASTTSWKVSKTGSSPCTLAGSSGSCNAYLGSASGDLIIHFGDISSYSDIVLTFNYVNDASASKNRTFECAVSSDGGKTWSSNVLPNSKSQAWTAASYNVTTVNAANFSVKFSNTATNLSRIDDVKLTGTAAPPTKCATPALSLDAGTYTGTQSVTLGCSTTDATIRYTTDGTDPTASSTVYSSAISVEESKTIKAKAFKDGLDASEVASAAYTIKCATPTFTKNAGTYENDFTVELSTTFGTSIYYTTDNSAPTTGSTLYSGAITVNATQTIKAIAVKDNCENSAVASAAYTLKCAQPTLSLSAATYEGSQNVTLGCTTTDAVIRYTLDGSDPSENSDVYSAAINIPVTKTLKARAFKTGYTTSNLGQATYTIKCIAPTSTPAVNGTYTGAQDIELSTTYGEKIYYTISTTSSAPDAPTTSSTLYAGPIHIEKTTKIKAIAWKEGCTNSNQLSGTYTIQYTVRWHDNEGQITEELVNSGSTSYNCPDDPSPSERGNCGDRFMGWTNAPYAGNSAPEVLFTSSTVAKPAITQDTDFYAVFADYVEK